MNSIGQPFVLSPTEVSPGHSLQSAAFREQLAGLSGFGKRERSHHSRECGSFAPRTKHDRTVHGPRRNCDCRDADSLACINSLPSLEAAGDELGPRHWDYSSNVSFERYVDCGENQENRHGCPQKGERQSHLRPKGDASSAGSPSVAPCLPSAEIASAI